VTYRERRKRKAERLREWADKREEKARQEYERFRQIGDGIPPGQPTLVGHHSEKGDRADLKRTDSAIRRSAEHDAKAKRMREKADNIERAAKRAIYSDDHDAIERLTRKIAALEDQRDKIKRYNATCRKGQPDPSILTDAQRRDLANCLRGQAYQCPGERFPPYVTKNLAANINRLRKRLAALQPDEH
jgi:hypothetical protein